MRRRRAGGRRLAAALAAILAAAPARAGEAAEGGTGAAPEEEAPPLVAEPKLVKFVEADYPEEARAEGVEGSVRLALTVDENGRVADVEVLRPAGHGFDEAAVAAARQLRFEPARDAEGPVAVVIEFEYRFSLRAREGDEGAAPVDLAGLILDGTSGAPLPGVRVSVEGPAGFTAETTTDADGRWALRGVPPGGVTVRAALAGHEPGTVSTEVVEGQRTDVTLRLDPEGGDADADETIVVVYEAPETVVTRHTISIDDIRRVPGTFGDPVRVIQSLPGAARAPFGTGMLVIRGANPEDSAVYIDGVRVPLIYHLGGYESVINPDLVDSVDYLPGGYGARYGRSTGGVVDVRTRTDYPDRLHGSWSTDLLDSGGLLAGRVGRRGRVGVMAAGRRSYIDAILPAFTRDSGFTVKPRWYDYQLRVDRIDPETGTIPEDRDELGLFVFGFQDLLQASTPADVAQGTDPDTQGDLGTTYSTHRAVLHHAHDFRSDLRLETSLSFGVDGSSFLLGDTFRVDNRTVTATARSALIWSPGAALEVEPGLDFIGGTWAFEASLPFDPGSLADYDPIGEREPWSASGRGTLWTPDLYVEARVRPLADRDRLLLVPGVRLATLVVGAADREGPMLGPLTDLDPRLAVRVLALPQGTFKAGAGVYHQPPMPFEAWRPEGRVELGQERATSYEIGWEQRFGPAVDADLSLFYRAMDDLIVSNPDFASTTDAFFRNQGIGRAYGAELILRHARTDRFFGWVSYTLSRSERNDDPGASRGLLRGDDLSEGGWYLFDFDQTHILTAVAGYSLPHDFEVSGRVQYVTGNPYTPYSGGVYDVDQDFWFPYATGAYNSERMPDFFALDLRASRLFAFRRWQLEAYLDLLNLVRGTNPEYVVYNYDYSEQAWIRGLPFVPSPGFEARFAW